MPPFHHCIWFAFIHIDIYIMQKRSSWMFCERAAERFRRRRPEFLPEFSQLKSLARKRRLRIGQSAVQ